MTTRMFESLGPTKKVSHRVVAQIVTRIANGELAPGDRLPAESALSEQFAVGLSSVREALAILEGLNVVETRQGSGRVVRGLTFAALSDPTVGPTLVNGAMLLHIYEVRETLESRIVRLATERADDADIERMQQAVDDMNAEVAQGGSGLLADRAFHAALARATNNPVFLWVDEALQFLTTESRREGLVKSGRPVQAASEHERILEAIKDRDPEAAVEVLHKHLAPTKQDALGRVEAEK
jgi:GntR family transcriptional repressor for pyruvate dehydrogenase complex